MSVVTFLKILLLDREGLLVALSAALALLFTVMVAKLVGCMFPMLAKKVGFDPAVMASPFITTIVDVLSLLIYFLLASVLLGL